MQYEHTATVINSVGATVIINELNHFGMEGWELVQVERELMENRTTAWFKRPITQKLLKATPPEEDGSVVEPVAV